MPGCFFWTAKRSSSSISFFSAACTPTDASRNSRTARASLISGLPLIDLARLWHFSGSFATWPFRPTIRSMRQSKLFTKTRREAPKDEVSKNAQLLIRAGYMHKEMAGVYDLLPLGLRTFEKVVGILREEINKIGGVEMHLSALQDAEVWKKTDRWDDKKVDSWFKTALKNGTELGLGFTHEEPLTALMREHVASYKDLPASLYQFQTK